MTAIIVSGTYLEWFKPAGTKSKETPGEDQNVGARWLDR